MSRDRFKKKRFGYLDSLFIEGVQGAPTVVLMHGFGADMLDLASLADVIQAPKGTNWVFPNGHLTVPLGGHYEGRGWFPISISELERTMSQGAGIDLSQIVPPGMKKARENALALVEALKVPMEKLVIGGFSQGGMVATDLVMHLDTPPAGLAVLSGTLVNENEWNQLAPKHNGFEFFQSHGLRDTVLSVGMAQKLESLLTRSGWKGRLQTFSGGHEIPPEVLIQLGSYLRKRFS